MIRWLTLALLLLIISGWFMVRSRPDITPVIRVTETSGRTAEAHISLEPDGNLAGDASGRAHITSSSGADLVSIPLLIRTPRALHHYQVAVTLPPGVPTSHYRVTTSPFTESVVTTTPTGYLIDFQDIGERANLQLELTTPPGSLISPLSHRLRLIVPRLLTICSALFPLLALSLALRSYTQAVAAVPEVSETRTTPPDDWPPALVGALFDEEVSSPELLATIVDLAVRKFVVMTEDDGELTARVVRSPLETRDFEQAILHSLERFEGKSKNVALFESGISQFPILVFEAASHHRLFVDNPRLRKNRQRMVGLGCLLFSLTTLLGGAMLNQPILSLLGLSGIISSGIVIGCARFTSSRSARGQRSLREWLAFRNYLASHEVVPHHRSTMERFYQFLPYAIALSVGQEWVDRHRDQLTKLPDFITRVDLIAHHRHDRFGKELLHTLTEFSEALLRSRDPGII